MLFGARQVLISVPGGFPISFKKKVREVVHVDDAVSDRNQIETSTGLRRPAEDSSEGCVMHIYQAGIAAEMSSLDIQFDWNSRICPVGADGRDSS